MRERVAGFGGEKERENEREIKEHKKVTSVWIVDAYYMIFYCFYTLFCFIIKNIL